MVVVAEDRGWKRTKSEVQILNLQEAKDRALEHYNLPRAPTERNLEPDRVKKLLERLSANEAISFNWSLVFYNGQWYRMNGQHSSKAILDFGGTLVPDELVFHVDSYKATRREGMVNLFQQHDARWSSRSKRDVSGAYQGLTPDVAKCHRERAKLAIDGVVWWRRTVEKIPVPSGDEQYELFFEDPLHPFIIWSNGVLSIKTPELNSPPVLGAMYATYCKSESGAQEFWTRVANGNNTDPTHPTAVLAQDLLESREAKKRGETRKVLRPGIAYGKCVLAWNVFRKNGDPRVSRLTVNVKEKGFPEILD
jgi:hypothetical protein